MNNGPEHVEPRTSKMTKLARWSWGMPLAGLAAAAIAYATVSQPGFLLFLSLFFFAMMGLLISLATLILSRSSRTAWAHALAGPCVSALAIFGVGYLYLYVLPKGPALTEIRPLKNGKDSFVVNAYHHTGRQTIRVWAYRPDHWSDEDAVLFVMHGAG